MTVWLSDLGHTLTCTDLPVDIEPWCLSASEIQICTQKAQCVAIWSCASDRKAEQWIINGTMKWLGGWYEDRESKTIESWGGVIIFNDCLLVCVFWIVRGFVDGAMSVAELPVPGNRSVWPKWNPTDEGLHVQLSCFKTKIHERKKNSEKRIVKGDVFWRQTMWGG